MKYVMRKANSGDLELLLRLRDEAAEWLRKRGSDQWSAAWPDPETMAEVICRSIDAGHTWCVEEDGVSAPIATLTLDRSIFGGLWTAAEEAEPAVYLHRLIVVRSRAGLGLGAQLLDWAGTRAAEAGAAWLRVDVWTTNIELQKYYVEQGFEHVRTVVRDDYPSGALLQKRADARPTPNLIER